MFSSTLHDEYTTSVRKEMPSCSDKELQSEDNDIFKSSVKRKSVALGSESSVEVNGRKLSTIDFSHPSPTIT